MPRKLLIVDDEPGILNTLERQLLPLMAEKFQLFKASSAEEALEIMLAEQVNVILADQRMPQISGTELFRQIKKMRPSTIRILMSGYDDFVLVNEAIETGIIYNFISKPWNTLNVIDYIREAFSRCDRISSLSKAYNLNAPPMESIIITDSDHIAHSVNSTFCACMEYDKADIVGHFLDLFCKENTTIEKIAELYQALVRHNVWEGQLCFKKKSGASCIVNLSVFAVKNDLGKTMRYIYSFFEANPINIAHAN